MEEGITTTRKKIRGSQNGNTTNTTNNNKPAVGGQIGGQAGETLNNDKIPQGFMVEKVPTPKEITIEAGEEITDTKLKTVRKPRAKKKDNNINTNDISMLLVGTFSLISMKAGEHWTISEEEANTVSRPLENILRKMDLLEKVTNVSDGAMLLFALSTITIPRVILSQEIMKQNKLNGGLKNGIKKPEPTRKPEEQRQDIENSENNNNGINPDKSILGQYDEAFSG